MRFLVCFAMSMIVLLAGQPAAAHSTRVTRLSPFPPGCNGETGPGTVAAGSEVQPQLAADPGDPLHLVGTYQQDRWSDIASLGAVAAATFDGGRTWTRTVLPVSECAGGSGFKRVLDAWATVGPDGTAHVATLSLTGGLFDPASRHAVQVLRSADGGRTWSAPVTVAAESGTVLNDFPTVTADPHDPRLVYLLWCRMAPGSAGEIRGPMLLSRSTDGGRTWGAPQTIYDGGPNVYTFANTVQVLPDGTLVLAFSSIFEHPVTHTRTVTAVALRSADKGRTWSAPITIADVRSVGAWDPDTGVPVLDAGFVVHSATDHAGGLYAAWQDSRFSGGLRDGVALSRSTDGGRTWSAPVAVNPDSSVPAFSIDVAARRDGIVGVAYYDFRPNTADPATLPTAYWFATSRDGGATWTERRQAGPFDLATAPSADIGGLRFHYMGAQFGLVARGPVFGSLNVRTTGDPANPTDLYATVLH